MCKKPSRKTYQEGCRCAECLTADRLYTRTRRGNPSTEPELTVEADIACEVIEQMHAAGMSYREIATRSGVSYTSVQRITHGGTHCKIETADAIYALQAEVELERPDLAAKWAL
jgi:ribosome-binding protein aMBF1 (putative translation factor)